MAKKAQSGQGVKSQTETTLNKSSNDKGPQRTSDQAKKETPKKDKGQPTKAASKADSKKKDKAKDTKGSPGAEPKRSSSQAPAHKPGETGQKPQVAKTQDKKSDPPKDKANKASSPKKTEPTKSAGNTAPKSNHNTSKEKATPIKVHGEVISWADAGLVAALDAGKLSSDKGKFVKANQFQYYVALNCWGSLWNAAHDAGKDNTYRRWIMSYGLHAAVTDCNTAASRLVMQLDTEGVVDPIDDHYQVEVPGSPLSTDVISLLVSGHEDDFLWIINRLRFLKRFTPAQADKLRASTLTKFISILDETNFGKSIQMTATNRDPQGWNFYKPKETHHYPWVTTLKAILTEILKPFVVEYKRAYGKFSSGVCSDAKNLTEKIAALSFTQDDLDEFHYGCRRMFCICDDIRRQANKHQYADLIKENTFIKDVLEKKGRAKHLFIPVVSPVPKSLKEFRTIAPESAFVSFHCQAVREALVKCMERSKYSDLFDCSTQEPNRILARVASIPGELAFITVDLSSASDRMARHVLHYFLPDDVWEVISKFLPVGVSVDGKVYPASTFLTSGNPSTFEFLGIWVLAIALTAMKLHNESAFKPTKVREKPQVFGDDAEVHMDMSNEFFDILERVGLRVNYEKTFSNHYRESCGVEFVDGYPTITDFWPRKTVVDPRVADEAMNVTTLTALQHKLFHQKRTEQFLTDVVLSVYPGMTDSEVGTECVDLWADLPRLWVGQGRCRIKEGLKTEDLHPDVVANGYMTRRDHVIVRQEPNPKWAKLTPHEREAVETYMYYRFLEAGPTYSSDLDKALRISSPTAVELQAFPPVLKLAKEKG